MLVLAALLAALPPSLHAEATSQRFAVSNGTVLASIRVVDPPARRILGSLRSGLRSQIRFVIRVYERGRGFLSFLGDRLVGTDQVSYEAQWDEFGGDYVITRLGATKRASSRFSDAVAFTDHFFSIADEKTGIRVANHDHPYVLSSVEIQTVELAPPLTMIAAFLRGHQISTPWIRTPLLFSAGG